MDHPGIVVQFNARVAPASHGEGSGSARFSSVQVASSTQKTKKALNPRP